MKHMLNLTLLGEGGGIVTHLAASSPLVFHFHLQQTLERCPEQERGPRSRQEAWAGSQLNSVCLSLGCWDVWV